MFCKIIQEFFMPDSTNILVNNENQNIDYSYFENKIKDIKK
jgi:hypothetical protein